MVVHVENRNARKVFKKEHKTRRNDELRKLNYGKSTVF